MEFQLGEEDKRKIDKIHTEHPKYNSLESQQVLDYITKRIQQLEDEVKGYLTDLKSSLEEYITAHKEEHKPKEEPVVLTPKPEEKPIPASKRFRDRLRKILEK